MSRPPGWQNPITATPGQMQGGIDPRQLLPARRDLIRTRLEFQWALLRSGRQRFTPIQVTPDGVIRDGHHAVRAAAEEGATVDVLVVNDRVSPSGPDILALPVR